MASNETKQESRLHRLFSSPTWFWFGSYWWVVFPCHVPPHQTPSLHRDNPVSSILDFTYTMFLIIPHTKKGGGVVSLNSPP